MSRSLVRIVVNAASDAALAAVAGIAAAYLSSPSGAFSFGPLATLWAAAAVLMAGLPFGLSVQYWRFAGPAEQLAVAATSALAAAVTSLGLLVVHEPLASPTFPLVDGVCLCLLLAAARAAYRFLHEPRQPALSGRPILLVGAGEGANLYLRALAADPHATYRPVGLLSLGDAQTGRRIQGYPILGSLADVAAVLDRTPEVEMLAVTAPDLLGARLAELLTVAEERGLRVARPPGLTTLGPAQPGDATELRPVAIEDLLNRPQVPLDRAGMARLIGGERVLVTGAGGTIGAELARQVAEFGPALLALVDHGEFALWQVDLELAELFPFVPRRAVLADVRDAGRMSDVCEAIRPSLVFHAAALKHVPMVEDNPLEGLLTNAVGTRNVADAARAAGARAIVLVSTDKAVNPASVMGASKRLAEMYCQGINVMDPALACVTVRFGNVLGSTGSVVPLFQRQLARGGPLTVTHPDMRRYFMTVREAVGLVLQATVVAVASTRDNGIFVLDMGEPVRILDLARQIIRLAGLRPDEDVAIEFTGLRPGEKLFEELFHGHEPATPTGTPGLLMAYPRYGDALLVGHAIDRIADACRAGDRARALAELGRLVPEFAQLAGQPA